MTVYQGAWKDDYEDGKGEITFANKETFWGQFCLGIKSGYGMTKCPSGNTFECILHNNMAHSFGRRNAGKPDVQYHNYVNGQAWEEITDATVIEEGNRELDAAKKNLNN